MQENEFYDLFNFIAILFILCMFLCFFFIYISSIVYYIKQNYNKNITTLWIDYLISISFGVLFSLVYLLTLLSNKTERILNLEEIYSNELFISSNSFLFLFFYSVINNSIFDIIKSFEIAYKIVKLKKINDKNIASLTEKLKEINIMEIIKPRIHKHFLITLNSINAISVIIFIIIYTNINYQIDFLSINHYKVYLLRNYHLTIFSILCLCILIMSTLKKKLLDNKYYTDDKFLMNIYKINYYQIIYYIDIFFFKVAIDLFVNIPLIFYLTFSIFNTFAIIFFELSLFIFIFIEGNILLSIDHNKKYINKIKKTKTLKALFCFKDIHLHFFNNAFYYFMNEYEYYLELSDEEKKILSELNINFIEKKKDNKVEINNKKEQILQIKEEDSKSENKSYSQSENKSYSHSENKSDSKSNEDNSDFDSISEYYALYKLLYAYFDKNKEFYSNLMKKVKKSGYIPFNADSQSIDKIMNYSEQESKNLIISLKLNKNDIFKNEKEKELLDGLNKKYKKSKKTKIQFIIESLSQKPLFEIFPFYQMKMEEILKALHPPSNIKLFRRFLENLNKTNSSNKGSEKNVNSYNSEKISNSEKFSNSEKIFNSNSNSEKIFNINSDKIFNTEKLSNSSKIYRSGNKISENQIIDNINVNDESKRKSNTLFSESSCENKSSESNETNCYQTCTNLLTLEIYNKSDFMDNKQILELNTSFKSYIIDKIKETKCSFLPLLLGIYNIKFLGKNKIVVIYRNPLYFGNSYGFSNWIHFYITENIERNKKSNEIKNEVIDLSVINEIEVKGNLKLNPEQYDEIKITLKNDIAFFANLSYKLFPILHLFVGYEKAKEDQLKKSHFMSESFLLGSLDSQKQHSLSFLLNSSSEYNNSGNMSMDKKDMISADSNSNNSLFDKDYTCLNDKYITIKIYLSNYFRYGNKCSNEDEVNNTLFTCEVYRECIQKQLFNYLIKNNFEDSFGEKKKKLASSLKSNEEEKIILKSSDS